MLSNDIQVKIDHFDGPLGLLLLLVQKEEMDIKNLNLNNITKQYLSYLSVKLDLNFDEAGEYLFLAATLLLLKSQAAVSIEQIKTIGNNGENGQNLHISTEAELIKRLEELERFQILSKKLWGLPRLNKEIFKRPKASRKKIVNSILTPMDLNKLIEAMLDLLRKEKRKYHSIKRDRLSIKEKLVFLKDNLQINEQKEFIKLLTNDIEGQSIENIVITFISLLELARLKRIDIFQNDDRGPIYVKVLKSLEDFDVNSADGFEEEQEDIVNESAQNINIM